jgi:hypothetical protein
VNCFTDHKTIDATIRAAGCLASVSQLFDADLKQGTAETNNLGLPLVLSGGSALTYTLTTLRKKFAVRCFHRDIPSVEQEYDLISKKLRALRSSYFVEFHIQNPGIKVHQHNFPIVRMDWVDEHSLGVWLDKSSSNGTAYRGHELNSGQLHHFWKRREWLTAIYKR